MISTKKRCYIQSKLLLIMFTVHLQLVNGKYNQPACHPGIMSLFKWCEQSDCKSNCTCLSTNHVCKQICSDPYCGSLFCSSPETCFQSVLISETHDSPKINKMISHSPIAQQDCSQGNCKFMNAIKYRNKFTQTFQSCSEGTCDHIHSTGDQVKQFCGNCNKMTCMGKSSTNCTQLCILGTCNQVICNSKHCKQLCSHESTCNLTCGPNTESCEQTCSHNSRCNMNCQSKQCLQICKQGTNCTVNNSAQATTQAITTATTETSTTRASTPATTTTQTTSPKPMSTTTVTKAVPNVIDETINELDNEINDVINKIHRTKEMKLKKELIKNNINNNTNDIDVVKSSYMISSAVLLHSSLFNFITLLFTYTLQLCIIY